MYSFRMCIIFIVCLVSLFGVGIRAQGFGSNIYIEKQLKCALDQAPCDLLGRQIKGALPEIIGKNCQKCNQNQLANAKRIARYVQTKYPDVWNALVQKYSPSSNSN